MRNESGDAWTCWPARDQLVITLGLAGLIGLAWFDVARRAGVFSPAMGREMAMPRSDLWDGGDVAATALMWVVMMAAMMLPAAAPMLLLFSRVNRRRDAHAVTSTVPTGIFLAGYLLVWTGWSLLAAGAQWGLSTLRLLTPALATLSPALGGLILVAAGVYQFSPVKGVCLRNCQSPLGFLFTHWRDGRMGALLMGLAHGAYCLGCCWVLMLLLFVGGVMNLAWIAVIAAFVLIERVVARGLLVSRVAGGLLVLWGLSLTIFGVPRS